MGINEKLKKLRKIKGINQEQAAAEIGVSLSSYQKYERDKNSVTPSLDVLVKLADFYNVSTDYLLDRQDEKQKLTEEIKSQFNMTALETLIVNGYLSLPKDMRSDLMEFLQKSVKKVMEESESVQSNAQGDSNQVQSADTYTCGELEEFQKQQNFEQGAG